MKYYTRKTGRVYGAVVAKIREVAAKKTAFTNVDFAGISDPQRISYLLRQMKRQGELKVVRQGDKSTRTIYKVSRKGLRQPRWPHLLETDAQKSASVSVSDDGKEK